MKLRLDSGLLCVTWWSLLVPAFSGKRTWWPVPLGEWMAGSLCSWLMPVLLWRSVHCGEVGVFWMISREWSQPPAMESEVNAMSLQRLWKSSGGCCRLGIQGWDAGFPGSWASESWQASEVRYFPLFSTACLHLFYRFRDPALNQFKLCAP